jgi:hypothetical protein
MGEISGNGNYNSGGDFILECGDIQMTFNEVDFQERTERAARRLKLINAPLDEDELSDLISFTVHSRINKPRSALADHIDDHREVLLRDNRDDGSIVTWLRRLIMREALLDKRVLDGELDIEFDPETGNFKYVHPTPDRSEVQFPAEPSWSDLSYHPEP